MAISVETVDCTSLGDSDFGEMADLCAGSSYALEVEELSKQAEAWVLLTRARDGSKLQGFLFCTLERIGGTPCVLLGAGHISRTALRGEALRSIIRDQKRRAGLSFPDEDVLFGAQINRCGAFEAYTVFNDVMPRPGRKPTGEDRAWGRRLAKRFGIGAFSYDDRRFVSHTKHLPPTVLDHESLEPEMNSAELQDLLAAVDVAEGDTLLVHGWAMSEELEQLV